MNTDIFKIRIVDETAGGDILNDIVISLQNEIITVKDIIIARVTAEVDAYNNSKPGFFRGLIQPTDTELTLNGFKMLNKKSIDPERQVYIALDAFLNNGFFILIDDRQANTLEEEVILSKNTSVSFIKLTPLVGG